MNQIINLKIVNQMIYSSVGQLSFLFSFFFAVVYTNRNNYELLPTVERKREVQSDSVMFYQSFERKLFGSVCLA